MQLGNHPGKFLADAPAMALAAYERAHGVLHISRAGALVSEQQKAIDRWDKGGIFNRPPYLYPPFRPAEGSAHVRNGGQALDTPDYNRFKKHSLQFGFKQTHPLADPVHFEFIGSNNQTTDEEPMIIFIQGQAGKRNGGLYYIANGVATFLGGDDATVPRLNDAQGDALATRVTGL